MKKSDVSNQAIVQQYLNDLDHPMISVVMKLRETISGAANEIAEQIKWNAPSFYYTGQMKQSDPKQYLQDIVVFNLHKQDSVMLVFPTGARIKDNSGLLEGNYKDGRRIAMFRSIEEVENEKHNLHNVIKSWIETVDR
jgi:hypothetical protein